MKRALEIPKLTRALYAMIFGSEDGSHNWGVEHHHADEKYSGRQTYPYELMPFKQRQRELRCALNLREKLQIYVDGDEETFRAKISQEATMLSENPRPCLDYRANTFEHEVGIKCSRCRWLTTRDVAGQTQIFGPYALVQELRKCIESA